jgi:hypothetical protein
VRAHPLASAQPPPPGPGGALVGAFATVESEPAPAAGRSLAAAFPATNPGRSRSLAPRGHRAGVPLAQGFGPAPDRAFWRGGREPSTAPRVLQPKPPSPLGFRQSRRGPGRLEAIGALKRGQIPNTRGLPLALERVLSYRQEIRRAAQMLHFPSGVLAAIVDNEQYGGDKALGLSRGIRSLAESLSQSIGTVAHPGPGPDVLGRRAQARAAPQALRGLALCQVPAQRTRGPPGPGRPRQEPVAHGLEAARLFPRGHGAFPGRYPLLGWTLALLPWPGLAQLAHRSPPAGHLAFFAVQNRSPAPLTRPARP